MGFHPKRRLPVEEEEVRMQAERDGHVRTKEDGHLQAKESGVEGASPADTLTLDFWPPDQ